MGTLSSFTVFVPKMLSDGVKAADMATNGVRTADGTMLIQDPSPWMLISAALGIRSTEVSLQRDLNAYQVVGDRELAHTKGRIMDRYVRAVQEDGDITGALADMMQWNELHPDAAIEGTAIRRRSERRSGSRRRPRRPSMSGWRPGG